MDIWVEYAKESDLLEADVVRWTEAIWERKGSTRKRAVKVGERQVTAEVIEHTGDGWATLLILSCVVIWDNSANRKAYELARNTEVRRMRKTILGGSPARLLWSDETAREVLVAERGRASRSCSREKQKS